MAQFARPDSDVSVGGWTTDPLYEKIDEETPSDVDYIQANNSAVCVIGLSNVADPGIHTGHVMRVRCRVGSGTITFTFRLKQGTTTIKQGTFAGTSFATQEITLLEAEAANISDYTDLRYEFTAGTGFTYYSYVSWAELEIPESGWTGKVMGLSPAKAMGTTIGKIMGQ